MNLPIHKRDEGVEALALGGFSYGYTVADMTGAFAMIANYGKFNKAHLIDRIVTADGKEIYNFKRDNEPQQIFSPQVSYQLIKMLRQVVTGGTAASSIGARISGYNIAGKTGTTTSQYDLWFVGFTPEISLGVWSGYDYNYTGNQNLAKNAWVKIFKAAAESNPELIKRGSNFKDPGGSLPNKCFECNKKSNYGPSKKKENEERRDREQSPQRRSRNEQNPNDSQNQPSPTPPPRSDNGGSRSNGNGSHDNGGNNHGSSDGGGSRGGGGTPNGGEGTSGPILLRTHTKLFNTSKVPFLGTFLMIFQ